MAFKTGLENEKSLGRSPRVSFVSKLFPKLGTTNLGLEMSKIAQNRQNGAYWIISLKPNNEIIAKIVLDRTRG